ncbi:MAG TPA: PLP-dependent aminotransferase family protein, partial [Candidatus Saccharimonadales bacterium]|nr:PLP-dependent aminotransferase family protein [Candidatus Saccharimonadales bacterium]
VKAVAAPATAPLHEAMPATPTWAIDFSAITPDVELFPRRAWLRATERALAAAPNEALDYSDHRGRIELRLALRDYLARVRGVRVDVERMVITQGFTQGLDLVSRTLRARGATTIAFETPSPPSEWPIVQASGLELEFVPVDDDGLRTDRLDGLEAAAVIVTPAHQFPTGAVLTPARREELVRWAAGHSRFVIEDDYDAEFRYDRNGIGAVQGLDPQHVIHIGTASKTLAPGIRIGWMSLPDELVDEVRAIKNQTDSGSPSIGQLALAHLLTSGDYDRHVSRSRQVYRHRRDALVDALVRRLPGLPIQGVAAGLHVLLRLPPDSDDIQVAADAASRGIGVKALSPMAVDGAGQRGLVLGYSRVPETRVDGAVAALADSLAASGVRGVDRRAPPS